METHKMSNSQWVIKLLSSLEALAEHSAPPRVAVMGIGNELQGDDALGVHLARMLKSRIGACERLLVLEAGACPENFCGLLRRFKPDLILLVDAVRMGESPGTVRVLDVNSCASAGFSTHAPCLQLLVDYLEFELGCEILLLGVQAGKFSFEASLSPAVMESVDTLVEQMEELLAPTLRERNFSWAALNAMSDMEFV
jgi:hydrogenase 3 maturation protease